MHKQIYLLTVWAVSNLLGQPSRLKDHPQNYVTVTTLTLIPITASASELSYGETKRISFNYTFRQRNITKGPVLGWLISAQVANGKVASINGKDQFFVNKSAPSGSFTLALSGHNAGRSELRFHATDVYVNKQLLSTAGEDIPWPQTELDLRTFIPIYVAMKERTVDKIFNMIVLVLVISANTGMGTQVDLNIVKKELSYPMGPIIGMFSQFVIMPLIAYTTAVKMNLDPGIGFGLFASGCAPGGLLSNMFTYLLGGNLSLSITMTLISTVASLGLIPLWLFTLGQSLSKQAEVKIPFLSIIISLVIIVVPTFIGLFLQWKCRSKAKTIVKVVKYMTSISMILIFTFGAYVSWWVLNLVDLDILFVSAALPYLGFILGGLAAFIGRQSAENTITIAIETGIQNTAVPILLLRMSLRGPEQATGIVVPLISSMLTPIPLMIGVVYIMIADYRRRVSKAVSEPEEPAPKDSSKDFFVTETASFIEKETPSSFKLNGRESMV